MDTIYIMLLMCWGTQQMAKSLIAVPMPLIKRSTSLSFSMFGKHYKVHTKQSADFFVLNRNILTIFE